MAWPIFYKYRRPDVMSGSIIPMGTLYSFNSIRGILFIAPGSPPTPPPWPKSQAPPRWRTRQGTMIKTTRQLQVTTAPNRLDTTICQRHPKPSEGDNFPSPKQAKTGRSQPDSMPTIKPHLQHSNIVTPGHAKSHAISPLAQ